MAECIKCKDKGWWEDDGMFADGKGPLKWRCYVCNKIPAPSPKNKLQAFILKILGEGPIE